MKQGKVHVWDGPLRAFHWLLVLCVVAAVVTGEMEEGNLIEWHARIGLAVVGLLAFRLVWGFIGGRHARFAAFIPTPGRIRAYLKGEWQGEGHNPLGALSVFGLLGILALQVGSGLVANDDIAFRGPLFELVGSQWSDRLTRLHHLGADALLILIGLHVAAIMFYLHVKKNNLVRPMLTGWRDAGQGENTKAEGTRRAFHPLALIVALAVAATAVYAASGAFLPPPPPPAPVETPAW